MGIVLHSDHKIFFLLYSFCSFRVVFSADFRDLIFHAPPYLPRIILHYGFGDSGQIPKFWCTGLKSYITEMKLKETREWVAGALALDLPMPADAGDSCGGTRSPSARLDAESDQRRLWECSGTRAARSLRRKKLECLESKRG